MTEMKSPVLAQNLSLRRLAAQQVDATDPVDSNLLGQARPRHLSRYQIGEKGKGVDIHHDGVWYLATGILCQSATSSIQSIQQP
jgi:hypothetical protein